MIYYIDKGSSLPNAHAHASPTVQDPGPTFKWAGLSIIVLEAKPMNNVYYRLVHLASDQDRAELLTILCMNVTASPGVPRIGSELWSAVPTFIRCSRYAVLLAASVIASTAFAQEKSRDLTTFFSGHLTATGQFHNYHDGSTRGVRVDIYGARDGDAFKLVEDTAYSDGEKHHWVWRFSKVADGRYVGRRHGLIGQAVVEASGNKIEIAYRAHVPTKDGKTHDLNFKETFVFTQSGTADYRLRVSLLSIPVGEAHLTVRKRAR